MEHLDDNVATEFVSGALPQSAVTRVEGHLAKCRDCRTLVAALAADSANDSNAQTFPHEKLSPSQVAQRPTRTLTIGDRVGRYLVLTTLGTGGMGVVFAAYDPQLDRKVALKLLRAGITYNTKDARARLRREAQAIAQLSHPNVVNVYDVGETDEGDLYIAMEFVEGDTLTTWLKKYPRTWREIADVFLQAARGLIAAHGVGLLHRDFKPDNVLVGDGDGRVRVTDFGLARSVIATDDVKRDHSASSSLSNVDLTATGTVLGTPRYMAPEQLTGADIDARADQFSFCVALYEALYGQHPLPGATSVSMLEKKEKAFDPPEGIKIPQTIARAVLRGLDRDPPKRFQSMKDLIRELVPPPKRSPIRYAGLSLAGLVLVAGAATAMFRKGTPEPEPQPRDNLGVQPLIDEINRLTTEQRVLIAQIERLTKTSTNERKELIAELIVLREALRTKDQQIQTLVDRVTELTTHKPGPRKPQSVLITSAVGQADFDLKGCFNEWQERHAGMDAELVVTLVVDQDGNGRHSKSAWVIFDPKKDSEILKLCVSEAIRRVPYPAGPDTFEVAVTVQWSEGLLNLAARITGKRTTLGDL